MVGIEHICKNCKFQIARMCGSQLYLDSVGSDATYVMVEPRSSCPYWTLNPQATDNTSAGERPRYISPSS